MYQQKNAMGCTDARGTLTEVAVVLNAMGVPKQNVHVLTHCRD